MSMALVSWNFSRKIRQVQYPHLLLGAIGRLKVCSCEVNVKGVEGEEKSLNRRFRVRKASLVCAELLNTGMNKPLLSGTIFCFLLDRKA